MTTRFSYPITVIQAGFLTSPEAGRESADVSEQAVHGAEAGAPSPSSENLSINSRHRRRGGTLKLGLDEQTGICRAKLAVDIFRYLQ